MAKGPCSICGRTDLHGHPASDDEVRSILSRASELLGRWVDSQSEAYSASLAVDSMEIVKRWQHGDFIKQEKPVQRT